MARQSTDATRRTVLRSIGATAALTAAAGCVGGGGNGGAENRFWSTQVEEDRQQVINGLLDRFESEHDGDLELHAIEEDDVPSQISSAQASDRLPSIAELPLDPMQTLGGEGLLSTDAAEDVIGRIGEDEFFEGALDLTTAPNGDRFAVPMHGWVQGFWYRRDRFEELGLDEPTDWDSLLEAAEALHDPDNDEYGIVVGSDETAFARQCFTPFARSNDARVFNEDGEIVFDSDGMVEALEFYGSLSEYSPPGNNVWEDANNTFMNEQSHLIEYSSYIMGDVGDSDDVDAENVGFAPFLENERQSSFGAVIALNLLDTASEDEREVAADFAEFVMTDEEYIDWLHMAPGGMNPVLREASESEAYRDNEVLQEWDEETIENISGAFETMERFGYVDGEMFPEFSEITSRFLVAEAVRRVSDGDDAQTVAEEQAEQMRDVVN
ncbi:ABC transporter substrate-binding protein [Natronococcus wangiae]|uniref:ABC transporter substrate-binding protein n=1 Tax=Natronococcus wangiae TaxID=3068275 RepID=UPI00273F417F|nr:ABC transporter substrate-binding protein [Natronococcus sp. AD5]